MLGDLLAIARHRSSTWAGLGPAEAAAHPAIATSASAAATRAADPFAAGAADPLAADPPPSVLAADRPWFAFLPGVARESVELGETAAIEEIEGGTAVRTGPLPLASVRAAIAPLLPDGVDVTLYPVTD